MVKDCFLLLGTNLGDKNANLKNAVTLIKEHIGNTISISNIYESEPWGYADNNSYLNQALLLQTEKSPEELLKKCKEIEKIMGRVRSHNGYEARPIDIDIIFYGQQVVDTENLVIPHPRMHERRFVLFPLNEIGGDFLHPLLKRTVANLKKDCKDKSWVKKIAPPELF